MSSSLRCTVIVPILCLGLGYLTHAVRAESIDQSLYRTIHEDWQSPFLDEVMKGATQLGDAENGLVIAASLLAFGDEKARDTGKLSLVSLAGASALTAGLKYAVDRDRPDGEPHDRFNSSFPSGHATGSFALASVVGAKYSKLRIPVYLIASLTAISRVYLGRHYPSDVLAGAGIGLCTGWLVMSNEETILRFHL